MLERIRDFEVCFGLPLDFIERDIGRKLDQREAAVGLVEREDAEVGNHHVDDAGADDGRVQRFRSLASFLAECSMTTTTFLTPPTRSMAPPIPLTTLPGIIQLARSPFSATCMAPRIAMSMWPPRIIANESDELK